MHTDLREGRAPRAVRTVTTERLAAILDGLAADIESGERHAVVMTAVRLRNLSRDIGDGTAAIR